MNIEVLLEKKEQIQVKILRQLFLKHDKLTAQELCDWVNLSRPSVQSYLEDISYIGRMIGEPMEVIRQNNKLVLNMSESQTLDEVISFLIQDSVKYRLILLFLEQKNYMIFELAELLLLSESTLFRKIKELNKLLLEFDIQIKNNKLIGEESQIRYFYYLLFDSLHPKFRHAEMFWLSPGLLGSPFIKLSGTLWWFLDKGPCNTRILPKIVAFLPIKLYTIKVVNGK